MKINRKQWSDDQYPDHWLFRVATPALGNIIGENNNIGRKADNQITSTTSKELPPMLIIKYRSNHTEKLAKKARNIAATQIG